MISFIAAMDENRVIGYQNAMPWHLPNDLKHFKETTQKHPIIMGRKTYTAIGRALPKRQNIVVTRDTQFEAPGCDIVHSFEEAMDIAESHEEIFVIGGETLFQQWFDKADKLYLTIIHDIFAGDTYFPAWDAKDWTVVEETQGATDEKNRYPHTFLTLERNQ
ncbi:dihydrofolate reductase [Alteribacillus persepolensis]|uniref:Dihydrofolate reductase n=1 Tax=Alteribacillus persepolensis TaxID=568899 RepID=A0A1G8DW69_9BACI|nr:dihydrofolate reductase [Alteribacillus persepolensis]SDH61966.1 dihydrofolate reductase [Alteribacillus persepolensis]